MEEFIKLDSCVNDWTVLTVNNCFGDVLFTISNQNTGESYPIRLTKEDTLRLAARLFNRL